MGYLYPLLAEDPQRIGVHVLVGRLDPDPDHTVYLGHLLDDETVRVIRLLAPRPDADSQARERITTALNAAKRASGAHTARLLEVGWFDDSPYVVREHVEGPTLRQAVAEGGPLTGEALERFATGTLTALTALHLSGLAHGALTPDTVILGPDGPRVFDIGLVPVTGVWDPDYLAPERPRADPLVAPSTGSTGSTGSPSAPGEADRPADLFAWAAIVVHAATGRPPFGGRPEHGPADLSGLPAELRPVLASCLAERPDERPDTKAAMSRLLGEREAQAPGAPAPLPGPLPATGTATGPVTSLDGPSAIPAGTGGDPADAPGGDGVGRDHGAGGAGGASEPGPFPGVIGVIGTLPGPGADTGAAMAAGATAGAESGTRSGTEPGTEPGAGTGAGADTVSDIGAGAASASGRQAGADITGAAYGDLPPGEAVPGGTAPRSPAGQATSVWGAPQLPQGASAAGAAEVPAQAPPTAARSGRTGGLSMALAACIGAIVLLSGLGLWAAGRYTALEELERASADGAVPQVALGLADGSRQEPQMADPGQAPGNDPAGKVTVPWGTTPDPGAPEVGPMRLPSDAPTVPPVPTIGPYTGPPVAVPTGPLTAPPTVPAVPTVPAAPTASATGQATPTAEAPDRPTPTPTVPVEPEAPPTGTPTPVPSPTPTPGRSGPPGPAPTPTPGTGTPTPSTGQGTPTPLPTLSPTVPPAARPTATAPTATRPTSTTPASRPSRSTTPSWAGPTPRPSQPAKPAATPSRPARPTVVPTTRPTLVPTTRPTVAPTVRPTFPTTPRPSGPPAAQRTNPFTAEKLCGPGFTTQTSARVDGGTTSLLYNASSGNGCAVTLKTSNVGISSQVWVSLDVRGGQSRTDRRDHEYYAGPVVLPIKGKCGRFTGGVLGISSSFDWGSCR